MNIDPNEIEKFESLAHRWWDRDGEFRPLHDINEVRMRFIANRVPVHSADVLEVGCGGGILTESMALQGARTTGIDPAKGPLTVAKLHSIESGLEDKIRYLQTTAEELVEVESESFDVVAALEILEHVPDHAQTVRALAKLCRPGGSVFASTINRHAVAYVVAIIGGEYVLNVLPKGTHSYRKFIKPSELSKSARAAGLVVKEVAGYRYNPFTRNATLTNDPHVNYLLHAVKPDKYL